MASRKRYFVGIDLAWSPRNRTGIAILVGTSRRSNLLAHALVRTDAEIVAFIGAHVPAAAPCLVAIDAPLTVPNTTGRRPCEADLTRDFRARHAGTHPSNRTRLGAWNGGIPRGEGLVLALERIGIAHDPALDSPLARRCFEVYPHPAMVSVFDLQRVLPYKSRPARSDAERWRAFTTYARLLRGLAHADPALALPRGFFSAGPLRGVALKAYEDTLDATFCGYIAQYVARHPPRCRVYGDRAAGSIVTPVR
jgi:predicted RNase H-like nuclease